MRKPFSIVSGMAIILVVLSVFVIQIAYAQSDFEKIFGSLNQKKEVVVERVQGADAFETKDGKDFKLIGLKAPAAPKRREKRERDEFGFVIKEPVDPEVQIEDYCYNFTKDLIEGKRVRLEFDSKKNDADFRTLVYVFLEENDVFINTEILRQGCAHLRIQPGNKKYEEELREAYREGRQEMRGLHNQ